MRDVWYDFFPHNFYFRRFASGQTSDQNCYTYELESVLTLFTFTKPLHSKGIALESICSFIPNIHSTY